MKKRTFSRASDDASNDAAWWLARADMWAADAARTSDLEQRAMCERAAKRCERMAVCVAGLDALRERPVSS